MADPSVIDLDGEPVDLFRDQITTAQAAKLAGVRPALIRLWAVRGILQPASHDASGRPRYIGIDVAKAEARTRRPHTRRSVA